MEDTTVLKMVRKGWFFFVVAFLSLYVLAIALENNSVFAAGPWKGRIIDMETKEPLEGAVVLAVWERVYRTPAGPNSYFYEAKEVITDREGRFEISSYTPTNLLPLISYMRGPYFTFFKPGYLSLSRYDYGAFFLEGTREAPVELPEMRKVFRLAPGIIELPKLKTREERLKHLPGSSDPFRNHYDKKRNYMRLLGIESKELGLQPETEPTK